MKKKNSEVSYDERKALESQVFSKLSNSSWFVKFIRLVIPSLVFAVACTTGAQSVEHVTPDVDSRVAGISYLLELKNELYISDSNIDFEAVMPESDLILSSTVAFTKKKHQDL